MRYSQSFRRVVVNAHDVMVPFIVLGSINVGILTVWTVLAPLQRVQLDMNSFDEYGRATETYGTCESDHSMIFYFLLCTVDITALVAANVMNYRARNISSNLHEATYICLSLVIMMEAALIGVPATFVLQDNPSAVFVVTSVIVSIFCGAILGPMFLPKMVAGTDIATQGGQTSGSAPNSNRRTATDFYVSQTGR